jgi:hypothetical protein
VKAKWIGWIIPAIVCFAISTAFAAPIETVGVSQCQTDGYLKDTDPRGTNVRSVPRANAPIIGHLPPLAPIEPGSDDLVGAEFDIIGAKDGWLLIRDAHAGSDGKLVFKGPGWISGRLVGFTLGGNTLRDAPDVDAKAIEKLSGELKDGSGYGPDSYEIMTVHGCESHFVDVTVRLAPSLVPGDKPMRGWVDKACSTQVTTCDPSYVPTPFDATHTETAARGDCVDDLVELLEGGTCKVREFGDIGAIEGRTFLYALYAIATKNGVVINTRAAVFERRGDGRLRLRLAPDGDGVTFSKPAILRTGARTLLHIPGSESGTGNFNHEALYLWRDGRWIGVDTESWLKTLQKRLPAGLGAWKGIYPDYQTLKVHTPLWRKGDSNACATGGSADIALAWAGDKIILSGVKVHRPRNDCNE